MIKIRILFHQATHLFILPMVKPRFTRYLQFTTNPYIPQITQSVQTNNAPQCSMADNSLLLQQHLLNSVENLVSKVPVGSSGIALLYKFIHFECNRAFPSFWNVFRVGLDYTGRCIMLKWFYCMDLPVYSIAGFWFILSPHSSDRQQAAARPLYVLVLALDYSVTN